MANKYVNSAATGANDGSSKTDAWTSLSSALGVAAGDFVLIDDGHSENPNTNTTWKFTNGTNLNPVKLLCIDFGTDLLSSGAAIANATGALTLQGAFFSRGVNFSTQTNLTLGEAATRTRQRLENCTLEITGTGQLLGAVDGAIELRDVVFDLSASGSANNLAMLGTTRCRADWIGGSYICRGTQTSLLNQGSGGRLNMTGVAISGTVTNLMTKGTGSGETILRGCSLPSYTNLLNTGTSWDEPSSFLMLDRCGASGSITVPSLGLTAFSNYAGEARATLSRYRTGGADDGFQANPFSIELITNSGALELYTPLTLDITQYVAAADASISGATAKNLISTTRCGLLTTPSACTTDGTSTWNGTGVGTKQQISVALSNGATLTWYFASGATLNDDDIWIRVVEPDQVGGLLEAAVSLAKPSTTVYFDPVPTVT